MKALERAIKNMKDDLKDSHMLFEMAKESFAEKDIDEAERYLDKAKDRINMWENDIEHIDDLILEFEQKEIKYLSENEKRIIHAIKRIYCKFYHHDLEVGKELKKDIHSFRLY